MRVIHIPSVEHLDKAADEFLRLCKNRFFFAFYGELGAGKTTFIRAVCKALGSEDKAVSPTFSIINEYKMKPAPAFQNADTIYHMDFYRLQSPGEALELGIDEYFKKGNAYFFLEWPGHIGELLPDGAVKVNVESAPDFSRTLTIQL